MCRVVVLSSSSCLQKPSITYGRRRSVHLGSGSSNPSPVWSRSRSDPSSCSVSSPPLFSSVGDVPVKYKTKGKTLHGFLVSRIVFAPFLPLHVDLSLHLTAGGSEWLSRLDRVCSWRRPPKGYVVEHLGVLVAQDLIGFGDLLERFAGRLGLVQVRMEALLKRRVVFEEWLKCRRERN